MSGRASRRTKKAVSLPKTSVRRCAKCGETHIAPTGAKCTRVPLTSTDAFPNLSPVGASTSKKGKKTSTPTGDTTNKGNQTLIRTAGGSTVTCTDPPINDGAEANVLSVRPVTNTEADTHQAGVASVADIGVANALTHLAKAVSAMGKRFDRNDTKMQALEELVTIKPKPTAKANTSAVWDDVMNMSRASMAGDNDNNVSVHNNVSVSSLPQASNPISVNRAEPVTVQSLRKSADLMGQAAKKQQSMQSRNLIDPSQGDYVNVNDIDNNVNLYNLGSHQSQPITNQGVKVNRHIVSGRDRVGLVNSIHPQNSAYGHGSYSIKSGRDRVGHPEHTNVLVAWPHQFVYVGPDRKMVRYEELTQGQWTAGLTNMASKEEDPLIQRNMFALIASLLQDVCDYGFIAGRGALALILTTLESSKLTWFDIEAIQAIREKYSCRVVLAHSVSQQVHSTSFQGKSSRPKVVNNAQKRVCRNWNGGTCNQAASHQTGNFYYEHICSFCLTKGSRLTHPEVKCSKKNITEVKSDKQS